MIFKEVYDLFTNAPVQMQSKKPNFKKFTFEMESFLDVKPKKLSSLLLELALLYREQNGFLSRNFLGYQWNWLFCI